MTLTLRDEQTLVPRSPLYPFRGPAGVLAAGLILAAGVAQAETPGKPYSSAIVARGTAMPSPPRTTEPSSDMGKDVEARIKALHAQLQITPHQEDKWNAVAKAMRDNFNAMKPLIDERRNKPNMTALENLGSFQKLADEHAAGVRRLTPLFITLYNAMSDAQKKNADAVFIRRGWNGKGEDGANPTRSK
jgi:glutamine synthetase adenylyltransferase